ncbi:2-methylcitrate synthase [invertebrate metagenome]|uniref:citrate synthase (unknown stereospecificity) n=1 Tax=invertebrate metagenome TaxID=1711999 RepID=A0A2H9T296_9ZZZZ
MTSHRLAGAGLRGQIAGETALCTVGQSGSGLTYCGYDIVDLTSYGTFEEIAWLLFHGELPTRAELARYKRRLCYLREIPDALKSCLEQIPANTHPMDVLRTGCSLLGNLEPEVSFSQQHGVAERLLGVMPSILLYWYHCSHNDVRIHTESDEETLAGHFLYLLHGKKVPDVHRQCLDTSLIIYAEHEFNASTFTARVCASTLSDMYSCITGAIGSLRGSLHGGANEEAMALIEQFDNPDEAVEAVRLMLDRQEKIMGFGHAVYQKRDPRNGIIKEWAGTLSESSDCPQLYDISEAIETLMWESKRLFANADFYHASAYHYLGIPTQLFTPLFVCSRIAGWAAHVMEQRANNRIIRPSADYKGTDARSWLPIEQRPD